MKVGVLCEFSGTVRDAFIRKGHKAISCDLLPTEKPGPHIQGNCLDYDWSGFDLLICHPPCTYLYNSGVRWLYNNDGTFNKSRRRRMERAIKFFKSLMQLPVLKIAIENPLMHGFAARRIASYSQIIQPYQFGEFGTKTTCLWLKGLMPLRPTTMTKLGTARTIVPVTTRTRYSWAWAMPPSPDRAKKRSVTFQKIAEAMANQWG